MARQFFPSAFCVNRFDPVATKKGGLTVAVYHRQLSPTDCRVVLGQLLNNDGDGLCKRQRQRDRHAAKLLDFDDGQQEPEIQNVSNALADAFSVVLPGEYDGET